MSTWKMVFTGHLIFADCALRVPHSMASPRGPANRRFSLRAATSEPQFQRELNDTRVIGADDLAESRPERHARNAEVGVVQRVEELRAELSRQTFVDREVLRQVEVEV